MQRKSVKVPRKTVDTDYYYYILTLKLNQLQELCSVFYVPSHGTLISQYLQTYRTIFYLLDLEVPELTSI